jgi:uncharacterized protein
MKRCNRSRWAGLILLALAVGAPTTAAMAQPAKEARVPAPIVFFDIAGPDIGKLAGFYSTVFGWELKLDTPFPGTAAIPSVPVLGPAASTLSGTLRREEAGDDVQFAKVIYLGVDDVTAALAKVEANGGKIHSPRMAVPGVVVLGLFKDPAGNVMGLIEMDGDKAKVP